MCHIIESKENAKHPKNNKTREKYEEIWLPHIPDNSSLNFCSSPFRVEVQRQPKEEELTAMKFMRRPDIDNLTRVEIAVQAFLGLGVYGEITRLARFYQVLLSNFLGL
jgi:hypothetical protein